MTSKLSSTLQGVMNTYMTGSTFGTAPTTGYPASQMQQAPYGPQAAAAAGQNAGWNHTPPAGPPGYPSPQSGFSQYPSTQQQHYPQQHPQQQPYGHPQQYQQQPQQYQQPQYQQQQQHMKPQHQHHTPTGHAGNRVVVVSPQFCFPQQTILVMQEQFGMMRNDNFTITDAQGRPFFTLAAAAISMRDKRQLLDAYNQPLVQMEQKMLSLHSTWLMVDPRSGRKLAEVKPALMSLTPSIKVYLNDGDKEADFVIKGNFRAKKFTISQRGPGKQDVVIASVQRESRFASATSFLMSAMTDAQKYLVTIEPGVDAAFVVALATLCDEVFNDQQGA